MDDLDLSPAAILGYVLMAGSAVIVGWVLVVAYLVSFGA